MASLTSFLSLSFCLLFLSHVCLAQLEQQQRMTFQGQGQQSRPRLRARTECNINRITAQEPNRRFESEAGITEFWDRSEELECAGVEAFRKIIQPRGLLLPYYTNAPQLVYVLQGNLLSIINTNFLYTRTRSLC